MLFDAGDLPPVPEPAPRGPRVGHAGKALLALLDDGEWRSTTWLAGMLETVRRYGVNQETVVGALKRLVEVGLVELDRRPRGFWWRVAVPRE